MEEVFLCEGIYLVVQRWDLTTRSMNASCCATHGASHDNLNPEPLPGPTGANPSGFDRSDLARPAPPGDPVNLKKRLGRTPGSWAACCFGRAEAAAC